MLSESSTVLRFLGFHLFELNGRVVTVATLALAALVVLVALGTSWVARRAIARALSLRGVPADGTEQTVGRLAHYAIVGAGVAVALQTTGVDLGALFAAGAVLAVGIGFGLQNIAQNFVSGLIVLVERSIRPGDVLELDGRIVRVLDIGIRATRVRSRDDETLIVPNSTLVQSTVRSFTLLDPLFRVRAKVGVAYDSDMRRVRAVLEETARNIEGRVADRDPVVLLGEFGPSSVDWEISIWTDDPWNQRVGASVLREAIWNGLGDAQIRIAFPQLDLHLDPDVSRSLIAGRS